MSMIVIYHVFVHGISPVYVGSHSILTVWYVPFIFGVNLFILISGYYGIRLSWKSFLSLMWIIVFYKLFHLIVDTTCLGFIVLGAIFLFLAFARTNITHHPSINFVAASMFPVYLIHEGGNVSKWYYATVEEWWTTLNIPTFVLYTAGFIIALFVLTIAVDQLRKKCWSLISCKLFNR